jgi:hypothetical protein
MARHDGSWVLRRVRSLAILELVNIPLQAVIWFGLIHLPVTPVNATGFALFALLLLEGAGYWLAKGRRIATGGPLPGLAAFRLAHRLNPVVLAAGLVVTTWGVAVNPAAATIPGLVFAVFAVLEHINYFHRQLMYDNATDLRYLATHGLRRAHLARDLAAKTGPVPRR